MATLVTGANGFIGEAVCERLLRDGVFVRGAVRTLDKCVNNFEQVAIGSLASDTDWTVALAGVERVVHLAARVHVMNSKSLGSLGEFRRINVESTAALARQAAAAGVRRFIFLSSIKVNGESTELGRPFRSDDVPAPRDPYGISKHEAEIQLRQIGVETGMEVVIIRPPLVYGPGVRANFASLMYWISRGVPLPLALVRENRRSLVALDNLADLIIACLNHPAAANQTLLVSDGESLSTVDLMVRVGDALGKPANLFSMPLAVLKLGCLLLGRHDAYVRLCGSLEIDDANTRNLLGWIPPVGVDEGLRLAAEKFR